MTIAYWCVLVALLVPYFLSLAARSQVSRAEYVDDPRAYSEKLVGWHRRAYLAHLNAFEAFPSFVAGVIVAELSRAPPNYIDALSVAFIVFRVIHAACYITDKPMLRSHAWRLGLLCVICLFVVSATAGSARIGRQFTVQVWAYSTPSLKLEELFRRWERFPPISSRVVRRD